VSSAKVADPIEMPFGLWTRVGQGSMCYMEYTLAQPGEYDWTARARRQCGLMSN